MLVTCLKRVGFFFRTGNVTSRHEPATLISWSLPRQRDVTPYRSPGCADVLRGARADVTDFSYLTLMDTSAVKHNMLKCTELLCQQFRERTMASPSTYVKKVKSVPLQARSGPEGSRKLRFPDFVTTAQALRTSRLYPPQEMLLILISIRG